LQGEKHHFGPFPGKAELERRRNFENLRAVYLWIQYTGRFIMFSVITNIYNKKTKGPTLMELFTATGKLKKFFF
jgi:hypothetical protein